MRSLEFLREECENVRAALSDTLRYDYGPERSTDYYNECDSRLEKINAAIGALAPGNQAGIAEQLAELSDLANWISLIERSRLGEFSWPFAEKLRPIAAELLSERTLADERIDPIIHVIAEGQGYQMVHEPSVPAASGTRRFVVVAFPRSLKHHVLLHAIFGHEICHTALVTTRTGGDLQTNVVPHLQSSPSLISEAAVGNWLRSSQAPAQVQSELTQIEAQTGQAYVFHEFYRQRWIVELTCDLFGLMLFGPGFLASHKTILEPSHPDPYSIDFVDPTHPPYALRHAMLAKAVRLLGWDTPVSANGTAEHAAESALLQHILGTGYSSWVDLFDDQQLTQAIAGLRAILAAHGGLGYQRSDPATLRLLVQQLTDCVPPVAASLRADGTPTLSSLDMSQVLYAGWVFWFSAARDNTRHTFLTINKLCDHALLQSCAIERVIKMAN